MKKKLLICVAGAVVLAWLSLIPGYYFSAGEKNVWLLWVTAVAVVTETGLWAAAATMGVAVFEARRLIWQRLTGKTTA